MAKVSITRDTWRCQPCQERVSLWSSPSSFLAVSKLSSIDHRCPSTATSLSIGVPAGHQVEKNGEKMPTASPWHRLVSEGGGDFRSPGYFDGEARLVSVRQLRNYPLVVDVAVSENAALAD